MLKCRGKLDVERLIKIFEKNLKKRLTFSQLYCIIIIVKGDRLVNSLKRGAFPQEKNLEKVLKTP